MHEWDSAGTQEKFAPRAQELGTIKYSTFENKYITVAKENGNYQFTLDSADPKDHTFLLYDFAARVDKTDKMVFDEEPQMSFLLDPSTETLDHLSGVADNLIQGTAEQGGVVKQTFSLPELTTYYRQLLGLPVRENEVIHVKAMDESGEKKSIFKLSQENNTSIIMSIDRENVLIRDDGFTVPFDVFVYEFFSLPQGVIRLPKVSFSYHATEDEPFEIAQRSHRALAASRVLTKRESLNHARWKATQSNWAKYKKE